MSEQVICEESFSMTRVSTIVAMMLAGVSASQANLIPNGDFTQGGTGWNYNSEQGNTFFLHDGGDYYLSRGWWNGLGAWRDTGVQFAANTVYSFSVTARTGDGHGRGVTVDIQDATAGWVDVGANKTFKFDEADRNDNNVSGPWHTYSYTFDTTTQPSLVGHNIAVSTSVYDDKEWEPNGWGWVHIKNLDLETVPEPSTWAGLGLGMLGLIARSRRKK